MKQTNADYTGTFDAKAMLKEAADKKIKMKYRDRMTVEMLQDTQYLKAGQIISPAKVKAEALIKQGLAKKVKKDD